MKLYGKIAGERCYCCGKPATTKSHERPMCLECAGLACKYAEYIKRHSVVGIRRDEP